MKVLVAYDGSKCADAAIEDLQRAGLPREGEALIVTVADEGWRSAKSESSGAGTFTNAWSAGLHEAETLATKAQERILEAFPRWKVSSESLWGSAPKAVLRTIDWWKPELLVIGSHGRSPVARFVLGSVSLNLIHHATCPVRIVRERDAPPTGPVRNLVATDGSPAAGAVLREVASRVWPDGTQARIISILRSLVPEPTMFPAIESGTFMTEPAFEVIQSADERQRAHLQEVVEAAAEQLERAGLAVDPEVLEGDPRSEILAEAKRWQAEAVFVGARGLGKLDRLLLGSVSTAVVTHADCTVEVIRHSV